MNPESPWFVGQRVRTIRPFTSHEGPHVPEDAFGEVIAVKGDRCTVRFFELKDATHTILGTSEIEATPGYGRRQGTGWPAPGDTLGPAGHRHVKGWVRLVPGSMPARLGQVELVVDLDQRAYPTRRLRDLADLLDLREALRDPGPR